MFIDGRGKNALANNAIRAFIDNEHSYGADSSVRLKISSEGSVLLASYSSSSSIRSI